MRDHSPSAAAFVGLVKRLCRLADRRFRIYQAHAALVALRELTRDNLIVNIPQGTGKTFVSQLVAHAYLRDHHRAKILVLVPTKELREQYVHMAEWMGVLSPRLVVLNFKQPLSEVYNQARV